MADSIDRVFVHALNTVKRIPRLGSARPPPAERLKLYGLYKQSMEGDVDGVMDRPRSSHGAYASASASITTTSQSAGPATSAAADGAGAQASEELRADQQKWDAWNAQKGLTRTDAKRRYITTLIDTMRAYASQTPDARELVTELEFVWDQIKSNPLSSSDKSPSSGHSRSGSNPNSASYTSRNPKGDSTQSASDTAIYPVMSERGSRNPRAHGSSRKRGREAVEVEGTDDRGLRVLSPISQGHGVQDSEGEEDFTRQRDRYPDEDDTEGPEGDAFVDAPDSQIADGDRGSHDFASSSGDRDPPSPSPARHAQPKQQLSAASAIIAPITKYIQKQTQPNPSSTPESTARWQRRIESALVKMNAEMAALREQLDMQHNPSGSVYSSIVYPFSNSRRNSYAAGAGPGGARRGILSRLLAALVGFGDMLLRHLVVDAVVLVLVTLWMHRRGLPPERLEELISSWIRRLRATALFTRLRRLVGGGSSAANGR